MRTLTCRVPDEGQGRQLGPYVQSVFRLGTHVFRRLKVRDAILVNGIPRHTRFVLSVGDEITLLLADTPGHAPADHSVIVHMDDDLIITNKPAPMPTLPGQSREGNTLKDALAIALGQSPEDFPFHPVSRLDKGTSGLLCLARHAHAQRLLSAALHTPAYLREYLAITEGIPAKAEGFIDAPIARVGIGTRRMVSPEGKPALTYYRLVAVRGNRALLRLRLETGRTHQIRVHLASIGCPIAGDYLYGTADPQLPGRFALHSCHLQLMHPMTGCPLSFDAPLPEELCALLL